MRMPLFAPTAPTASTSVGSWCRPKPLSGRVLRAGFFLLAAALAGLLLFLNLRPQSLEGQGEVFYTDEDGTYQIFLGKMKDSTKPVPEIQQKAELDMDYRFPSCLYVRMADSGANAGQRFLQKTENITTQFIQPDDSPSPMVCSEPAPQGYAPEAAYGLQRRFYRPQQAGQTGLDAGNENWGLHPPVAGYRHRPH